MQIDISKKKAQVLVALISKAVEDRRKGAISTAVQEALAKGLGCKDWNALIAVAERDFLAQVAAAPASPKKTKRYLVLHMRRFELRWSYLVEADHEPDQEEAISALGIDCEYGEDTIEVVCLEEQGLVCLPSQRRYVALSLNENGNGLLDPDAARFWEESDETFFEEVADRKVAARMVMAGGAEPAFTLSLTDRSNGATLVTVPGIRKLQSHYLIPYQGIDYVVRITGVDFQRKLKAGDLQPATWPTPLNPDAPPVPAGLMPKSGVEYGCGEAICCDCYQIAPGCEQPAGSKRVRAADLREGDLVYLGSSCHLKKFATEKDPYGVVDASVACLQEDGDHVAIVPIRCAGHTTVREVKMPPCSEVLVKTKLNP